MKSSVSSGKTTAVSPISHFHMKPHTTLIIALAFILSLSFFSGAGEAANYLLDNGNVSVTVQSNTMIIFNLTVGSDTTNKITASSGGLELWKGANYYGTGNMGTSSSIQIDGQTVGRIATKSNASDGGLNVKFIENITIVNGTNLILYRLNITNMNTTTSSGVLKIAYPRFNLRDLQSIYLPSIGVLNMSEASASEKYYLYLYDGGWLNSVSGSYISSPFISHVGNNYTFSTFANNTADTNGTTILTNMASNSNITRDVVYVNLSANQSILLEAVWYATNDTNHNTHMDNLNKNILPPARSFYPNGLLWELGSFGFINDNTLSSNVSTAKSLGVKYIISTNWNNNSEVGLNQTRNDTVIGDYLKTIHDNNMKALAWFSSTELTNTTPQWVANGSCWAVLNSTLGTFSDYTVTYGKYMVVNPLASCAGGHNEGYSFGDWIVDFSNYTMNRNWTASDGSNQQFDGIALDRMDNMYWWDYNTTHAPMNVAVLNLTKRVRNMLNNDYPTRNTLVGMTAGRLYTYELSPYVDALFLQVLHSGTYETQYQNASNLLVGARTSGNSTCFAEWNTGSVQSNIANKSIGTILASGCYPAIPNSLETENNYNALLKHAYKPVLSNNFTYYFQHNNLNEYGVNGRYDLLNVPNYQIIYSHGNNTYNSTGNFWSFSKKTLNVNNTYATNESDIIQTLTTAYTFTLPPSGLATLKDTNNNTIDDSVPAQITSTSGTSIKFNSSQNYTGTNWQISVVGDLTGKTWKYKAHNDNTWLTVPAANVSYNGSHTLFNLQNINVSEAANSNELAIDPTIDAFRINDTYINFNQSVLLTINVSHQNSTVFAELQTSAGLRNSTLNATYNVTSGNFTLLINATDLGNQSANATRINITKIYAIYAGNTTVNTTSLYFDYGRTILSGITQSRTDTYQDTGIAVTAKYYDTENVNISSACFAIRGLNVTSLTYSAITGLHTGTIPVMGLDGEYNFSVTCNNTAYQTQTNSSAGSFIVRIGQGGGGGTGSDGGAGNSLLESRLIISTNPANATQNEPIKIICDYESGNAGNDILDAAVNVSIKNLSAKDVLIQPKYISNKWYEAVFTPSAARNYDYSCIASKQGYVSQTKNGTLSVAKEPKVPLPVDFTLNNISLPNLGNITQITITLQKQLKDYSAPAFGWVAPKKVFNRDFYFPNWSVALIISGLIYAMMGGLKASSAFQDKILVVILPMIVFVASLYFLVVII